MKKAALLLSLSFTLVFCSFQKEKWIKLFNGKDFSGWTIRGEQVKNDYRIENGEIVGTSKPNSQNTFLCTDKNYDDFILELEVKVDTGMNSGIQFRSESRPDYRNGRVHGYQAEIDPSARAWSGGLYDEARRGWLVDLKNNPEGQRAFRKSDWNKYRIEAIGKTVKIFLNGVQTTNYTDTMATKGFIALQVHGTKVQRPMEVRWRNVRLQELARK
ncbi:3-keto-disaccharide hydrolase [Larkinella sp. VNQ87]|uniref:3-keto-disaccharide hydrolase n=1 Tax=Larkinella sp. VNQ87 TaxID=3400921 RepID=UPI003C0C2B3E